MKSEDNVQKEIKEIAEDFPLRQSVKVPDNYFEEFPDKVLNLWKKDESVHLSRRIQWKKIMAIAAISAAMIVCTMVIVKKNTTPAPITAQEAYHYIYENIDEFEDLLEENAVIPLGEVQGITEEVITEEEIRQFILEETDNENIEELF